MEVVNQKTLDEYLMIRDKHTQLKAIGLTTAHSIEALAIALDLKFETVRHIVMSRSIILRP